MVRPRKPGEEKRSEKIGVRFKRRELIQLDLFSAGTNQTISDYVRASALGDRPQPRLSAELKHDIYRALLIIEIVAPDPELTARIRHALAEL